MPIRTLVNEDSKQKLKLGTRWASMCGEHYEYYMVFESNQPASDHTVTLNCFLSVLEGL